MKIIEVKLTDLKPAEYNPRALNEKEAKDLIESLKRFGMVEPIVVNGSKERRNVIIGGHQRLYIWKELKHETIPVVYVNIADIEKEKELNLRLNKNLGHWDWDLLANFDDDVLNNVGFTNKELSAIYQNSFDLKKSEIIKKSLISEFLIPPFSVFDTKAGYWQERKKLWLNYFGDGLVKTKENLWSKGKVNMMSVIGEGSSMFDPVLAEVMYKWFVPKDGIILNPFCGEASTGMIAAFLGYKYIGIDVRQEQIDINNKLADEFKSDFKYKPEYICADSNNVDKIMKGKGLVDFIFTSPPYFGLECYSLDPKDVSGKRDYSKFLESYTNIFSKAVKFLNKNRFLAVKVGDVRFPAGNGYLNFVGDNVKIFRDELKLKYYNEFIILNMIGTASIRASNAFKNRKAIKIHQNVEIFNNGDIKKAYTNMSIFYEGDINAIKNNFGPPNFKYDIKSK